MLVDVTKLKLFCKGIQILLILANLFRPVCCLIFEKHANNCHIPQICFEKRTLKSFQLNTSSALNRINPIWLHKNLHLNSLDNEETYEQQDVILLSRDRRFFLGSSLHRISALAIVAVGAEPCSAAVERAVGGSELKCQQVGNCLKSLELDGAIGWTWGGRSRCDASDPKCGVDGQALLNGEERITPPVPDLLGNKITHVVEMDFIIGREKEQGTMRIGLYGEAHSQLVGQLLDFFDERKGLVVTSRLLLDNGPYGAFTAPLFFSNGGALTAIYPQQRIEFGVPSQAAAHARSKGRSKAGEDFVPQPRPPKIINDGNTRKHDCAGLLSISSSGLGYGGTGLESTDQAYASAFQVTASPVSAMDGESRTVVGQAIDIETMALIQRLASIPTNKGIKGIVPGLNNGPPLIKVSINDVRVKELAVT